MRKIMLLLLMLCFVVPGKSDAALKKIKRNKVALVIGNSNYKGMAAIKNPSNDAKDVAAALRSIGFDNVVELHDLSTANMAAEIEKFGKSVRSIDIVVFYYAGHGFQADSKNYLVPIDAIVESKKSALASSYSLDKLFSAIKISDSTLNIVVLDTMFNSAFDGNGSKGQALVETPINTLMAFAAAPNGVAMDGKGRNGVYTEQFLKALQTPNLTLEEIFNQTRRSVIEATSKQQFPWESSSLTFQVILNDKSSLAQGSDTRVKPDVVKDNVPPAIVVISPEITRSLKVVSKSSNILVKGKATSNKGISQVTINGEEASLDESGNFSADILLKVGENFIEIKAIDTKRNIAVKNFTIARNQSLVPQSNLQVEAKPALDTGQYHALIIGVKDYADEKIPPLDYPIQDAQRVYDILTTNYKFEKENVILLHNPDQPKIVEALDGLANRVKENDSLLIFYAGHGYWDDKLRQGFWLPANAKAPSRVSRAQWLSNSTVKDYIQGIKSKHTLLIADACFSGGIFKVRSIEEKSSAAIQELYKLQSRKAMTSGTMKEVPDQSVFVEFLLKRLKENSEEYISSRQLFSSFEQAVINNSPNRQVPQYGEIRETGDEGGDFIFIRRHPQP